MRGSLVSSTGIRNIKRKKKMKGRWGKDWTRGWDAKKKLEEKES